MNIICAHCLKHLQDWRFIEAVERDAPPCENVNCWVYKAEKQREQEHELAKKDTD